MPAQMNRTPSRRSSIIALRALALASAVLFVASLFGNAYCIDEAGNVRVWMPSYLLLLIGWLGPAVGVFAWLANPALVIAWIAMVAGASSEEAICPAMAALLLALSFLLHRTITVNEAGHFDRITGYGWGYWLWLGSAATAFVGCLAGLCLEPSEE
jgi:hypothetical protein